MVTSADPKVIEVPEDKYEEALFFSDFLERLIVVEGRKGSGKTTFAVALAYKLRELFNRPAIFDFPAVESEFGPYSYLEEQGFLEQLSKVSDVAKNTSQEMVDLAVRTGLKGMGIELAESTVVFDEAYRYFDCRTPSDKLVRVFGYFIAQSRHYKNTVILLVPNKSYLDRRVRQQIDFTVRVAYNLETEVIFARCLSHITGEAKKLRIYSPNYRDMFDSWGAIKIRQKVLKIGGTD